MDTHAPPAGAVVVGLDGSSSSHGAFGWGAEQAALERRPLVLAHAVPDLRQPDPSLRSFAGVDLAASTRQLHDVAAALLRDVSALARTRHPGLHVHQVLSTDEPGTLLLDLAARAAMLVVGSRGHGHVSGMLLGSVSTSTSLGAPCPVVVCRPLEPVSPRYGVLVGVGAAADHADQALQLAFRIAATRGLPLTVLHLWAHDAPRDEASVAAAVARASAEVPEVHVSLRRAHGDAERHLVTATRNYDLVVVGHQVDAGLGHRSVARAVVEQAHGPAAVVCSATNPGSVRVT